MQAALQAGREAAWLNASRIQGYSLILLVAYLAFAGWLLATSNGLTDYMGRPLGTDFAGYWSSGHLALSGRGAAAFDPAQLQPFQQALIGQDPDYFNSWHYPPQFLAVTALLALLPYTIALLTWIVASTSLYAAMMLTLLRGIAPSRQLIVPILAFPAIFANATHGQNGALSASLIGLGLIWLKERPVAAGVALGLLAYKPQYGILLPLALAIGGYWRTFASAMLTVVVTVAISIALFGVDSWQSFIAHASFTKEAVLEQGAAGWFKLQGVFPAVRMLGASVSTAYVLQITWMALVAASIAWLWRSTAHDDVKAAGLVIATAISTPYAFNYDMVILAVAIGFLTRSGLRDGFAPYQRALLALLWISPLCTRELTMVTHIPVAILLQSAVYLHLLYWTLVSGSEASRTLRASASH